MLVELENINKKYGNNIVFQDLSLQIEKPGIYGVLGQNGAGKSSLMRIIAGLEGIDSGLGNVLRFPLENDSVEFSRRVGFVSESQNIHAPWSLGKILNLAQDMHSDWQEDTVNQLLKKFRLNLKLSYGDLSRGQRVQFHTLIALGKKPRLLLLDEVTAVLDIYVREQLFTVLQSLADQGITTIISTNIISEIQHILDAIILVAEKKVIFNKPMISLGAEFVRLRHRPNTEADVLRHRTCKLIGKDNRDFISLIPRVEFSRFSDVDIVDKLPASASDVFIYFTTIGH